MIKIKTINKSESFGQIECNRIKKSLKPFKIIMHQIFGNMCQIIITKITFWLEVF